MLSALAARAAASPLFRHAARFLAGSSLAYAAALAVTPLLTRLYTPQAFGIFALLLVSVAILSAALNPRWDIAIPSVREDHDAALLGGLALLAAPVSALAGATLLVVGVLLGLLPMETGAAAFVGMVALLICLNAAFNAVHYHGVRHQHFGFLGRQQVVVMAVRLVTQIGGGLLGGSALGLSLGEAAGRAAGLLQGLRLYGRDWLAHWRARRPGELRAAVYGARKFTFVMAPSTFIDTVGNQLPALLIAANYGLAAAGLFAIAEKVVFAPVNTVGRAAAESFHGHVARLSREAPGEAAPTACRLAFAMLAIGVVPLVTFLVAGPSLFGIVFGEAWRMAGAIAAWIAITAYGGLLAYPLGRGLQVAAKQEWKLVFDVLSIVVTVLSLGLAKPLMGLDVMEAIAVFAVLMFVVYLVSAVLSLAAIRLIGRSA